MISDVLWEAEQEIEQYLDGDCYEGDLRTRIEKLLAEMRAIRALPGMDSPPDAAIQVVHITTRKGG